MKNNTITIFRPVLLFFCLFSTSPFRSQSPEKIYAPLKILKVLDGDTYEVKIFHPHYPKTYLLRPAYIDAPERSQRDQSNSPIGTWIHKKITKLIMKNHYTYGLQILNSDIYHRLLGEIFVYHPKKNSLSILNLTILKKGLALLYPHSQFRNMTQKYQYLEAMRMAFNQRRGLFSKFAFTSPSHYRKSIKKTKNP